MQLLQYYAEIATLTRAHARTNARTHNIHCISIIRTPDSWCRRRVYHDGRVAIVRIQL